MALNSRPVFDLDIEYELPPLCSSEGVGVTACNPLAAGILTGKHDPTKPPASGTRFTMERMGPIYPKEGLTLQRTFRFW